MLLCVGGWVSAAPSLVMPVYIYMGCCAVAFRRMAKSDPGSASPLHRSSPPRGRVVTRVRSRIVLAGFGLGARPRRLACVVRIVRLPAGWVSVALPAARQGGAATAAAGGGGTRREVWRGAERALAAVGAGGHADIVWRRGGCDLHAQGRRAEDSVSEPTRCAHCQVSRDTRGGVLAVCARPSEAV